MAILPTRVMRTQVMGPIAMMPRGWRRRSIGRRTRFSSSNYSSKISSPLMPRRTVYPTAAGLLRSRPSVGSTAGPLQHKRCSTNLGLIRRFVRSLPAILSLDHHSSQRLQTPSLISALALSGAHLSPSLRTVTPDSTLQTRRYPPLSKTTVTSTRVTP